MLLDNQEKIEFQKNTIYVIDFWGSFCPPCVKFKPIFEKIGNNGFKDFVFLYVNVEEEYKDQRKELVKMFSIRSIPAIVVMKDFQLLKTFCGYKSESDFLNFLESI